MRVKVAAAALLAALVIVPAGSAQAEDVTVTSFDGTPIVAHWFANPALGPGQRAPVVLNGPGWAQAGANDPAQGVVKELLDQGYSVLTWDPRGFGRSGGLATIDAPYAIVVVPLLLETDFAALVERILVVDCPREMQLERLMRRDSMTRPRAVSVLAAQIERTARLDAADDVIDNSGTLEHTRVQVAALHARYLELARDCPSPQAGAE